MNNTPLESWLEEEGISLVIGDNKVFTDPAIYMPGRNPFAKRAELQPVIEVSVADFEEKIRGKGIFLNKRRIQCPKNWGENYEFVE